jgi:hypothetical protein
MSAALAQWQGNALVVGGNTSHEVQFLRCLTGADAHGAL